MSCLHYRIPVSFRNLGMKANAYLTVNMFRGEKIWVVEMVVARQLRGPLWAHRMRWKWEAECWKANGTATDVDYSVSGFLLIRQVRVRPASGRPDVSRKSLRGHFDHVCRGGNRNSYSRGLHAAKPS